MTALEIQDALHGMTKADPLSPAKPCIAIWARSALDVPESLSHRVALHAMPQDPAVCAHQLFAQLRSFDAQGVAQIWVETPPLIPAWDGVRDRLTRAATLAR
jgi:L-threonylcarbamoyladenylate synthase